VKISKNATFRRVGSPEFMPIVVPYSTWTILNDLASDHEISVNDYVLSLIDQHLLDIAESDPTS